jgi:prepilin-type N-terminal cleavage/methylation domain-containing protein
MKKKNHGFTLVELLIVMAILVTMATILIGIINPIALIGKARDSRRKDDLNKIKMAFDEYYNDKKQYPSSTEITQWNQAKNCGASDVGGTGIGSYTKGWPCDPSGKTYDMVSNISSFRVITNLENKSDKDVPKDWYKANNGYVLIGFTADTANYGVSSSNIYWYDYVQNDTCNTKLCTVLRGGRCDMIGLNQSCVPSDGQCFYANNCDPSCITLTCTTK